LLGNVKLKDFKQFCVTTAARGTEGSVEDYMRQPFGKSHGWFCPLSLFYAKHCISFDDCLLTPAAIIGDGDRN